MTVRIELGALKRAVAAKAISGVRAATAEGEVRVKAILSEPGAGRIYGRHQGSAPGQSPAPDTGHLRSATQADPVVREDADGFTGRVVANTDYALALEIGTERMAARPFLDRLRTDHAVDLHRAFLAGAKD